MSDLPPAGTEPTAAGPAVPPQPPAPDLATPAESGRPATAARRRRLPSGWGAWLLVLVVAIVHLATAVQSVGAGALVPAIDDLRGEDILTWLGALLALYVRPEVAWDTSRLLALWMLVLLVTSVYASLRAGMSLPHGVLTFVGYALTSAIILGVATPAVWYVFGPYGPPAAAFVPPLAMTAVAMLSLRNVEG